MIVHIILYYLILSFLFFGVSLFTKAKYAIIVVLFNVVFLGTLFYSYLIVIGNPIPYQYHLNYFKQATLSKSVTVKTWIITDNVIYLTVKDGLDYKFVSFNNTPEFLAQLKEGIKKSDGKGDFSLVESDTLYPDGSEGHFVEKDTIQANMHEVKPDSTVEGVDNYTTNGKGINTDPAPKP